MNLALILAVCKQARLSHLGHRKPAHIHWKAPKKHPKRVTVWWGFRYRGMIGPFCFENQQGEAVTVNGDRYRAMLNEFLFKEIEEEDISNIWFQRDGATGHTAEATTLDVWRHVFEDLIISRRTDVCGHLGAAIWHRWTILCGVPSKIDAFKDNIREAIGEIQLHTIDNVLISWTDRVGCCMASRGSHLNEIIFYY